MSLNKVIIIGHLGKDPEVRYLDSGVAVAQLAVATSERGYTTKAGVEVPPQTEWHAVVVWRQPAEFAEKYLHKGDLIYVEGKLKTRKWEKDGIDRYTTEIECSVLEPLNTKRTEQGDNAAPAASATGAKQPEGWTPGNDKDDLPF